MKCWKIMGVLITNEEEMSRNDLVVYDDARSLDLSKHVVQLKTLIDKKINPGRS